MNVLVVDALVKALAKARDDASVREVLVEMGLFAGTASEDPLDEATCDAIVARVAGVAAGTALEVAAALFCVGPGASDEVREALEGGAHVAFVDLRGVTRARAREVLAEEGGRTISGPSHPTLGLAPLAAYHEGRAPSRNAARAIASVAHGVARAAYETARAYASERKQFGRAIETFPAIAAKLDRARALLEARAAGELATAGALEIAHDALQIHGGYGYTREYTVERLYRDALELHRAIGATTVPTPRVGALSGADGR